MPGPPHGRRALADTADICGPEDVQPSDWMVLSVSVPECHPKTESYRGVRVGIMLGSTGSFSMQTRSFPSTPDGRSPAGAEIRHLIEGETGGMIHSTVPPGQVNR